MGYRGLAVFHNPQLEHIIEGMRRLQGEAGTKERRPITKDLLLQILPYFDHHNDRPFALHLPLNFLVGEFTYPASDRKNHLELTLPALKTDPFRRGITLTVASCVTPFVQVESRTQQSSLPAGRLRIHKGDRYESPSSSTHIA
jgi:hypothetical protein